MPKPVTRKEAYSRVTITIPTFAVIMLRQFAKRRNEKQGGGAETVSTVLESWILPLLSTREIAKAGKDSPEFERAAEAWIQWEAQERARRPRVTRLQAFMTANKLKPSKVALAAKISRQHLLRLRKGTMQPTIRMAASIRGACGRLLKRRLKLSDLFEV